MSVLSRETSFRSLAENDGRGVRPWVWLIAALVPLAIVYLLMLNPYWVPSGDGEVYTCIARSLVKGEGLRFNGSRAAIAPPGWPLVLSWAMQISPQFLFLKLVTMSCMLASFVPAFYLVRRFLSDRVSAGVILLTGTLSTVYPLTFWMHTEAFFCLLGFSALLIAYRIRERRANLWVEVPLMLFLLGFGAFTRWPGVLHLCLVAPILFSGENRPWLNKGLHWLLIAVFVVCAGTYLTTQRYLSLSPDEQRLARASGGTAETEAGDDVGTPTTIPTTGPSTQQVGYNSDDDETPTLSLRDEKRGPIGTIIHRIEIAGKWFSWLLWQPTRFGQSVNAINVAAMTAGWFAIALLALTLFREIRRRDYFWIGLAVYTGGLCIIWDNPNARYFVPVAPFIIAGILMGLRELAVLLNQRRNVPGDRHPLRTVLVVLFVIACIGANWPLLVIEIGIFRSNNFYAKYEAGANLDLLSIARYINTHPHDGTIVINELYDNMGRQRYSKYGMRALHLLTNEPVIGLERKRVYRGRPTEELVRRWLKNQANASFCIYQAAWNPWRVWHFRLSPELQKKLTGRGVPIETGGWELFERENAKYPKVDRLPAGKGPTRVPGL